MALRTPDFVLLCSAARKTRSVNTSAHFQSGETSSIPGTNVPRARSDSRW